MIIDSGIATGSLTVSGSFLVSGSSYLNGNTNVTGNLTVTGFIVGDISGSATTASYALTASYAPDYLPLAGGTVTGDLIVEGTASIAYLDVTFESASIIYSSGSNIFGDTVEDTQTLYGTVVIPTGSFTVTGSIKATQGIYGELFGTASHAYISDYANLASQSINSYLANTASYANSAGTAITAPFYVLTSSFDITSGSLSTRVTNLESWSSSLDTGFVTEAELAAATASLQAGVTASISDLSSSIAPQIADLQQFSSSYSTGSFTGSFAGDGSGLTNIPASGIVGLNLSQIASGSATASISPDNGFTVNTNTQITGSLQVTEGITGSFSGSLYNLQNTAVNHIPYFNTPQTLVDSAIIQVDNGLDQGYSIAINQNNVDADNPEALFVYQASTSSYNVISGKGNLNSYLQLNIQNLNNGSDASSDIVATANNGNESVNYIDMGINNANFSGPIGAANDAYLYSTGQNLHIGNVSELPIQFFVSGTNSDNARKFELNSNNEHNMTGSLNASAGFIGNLTGNAATATTASNALTASSADSFFVRNNATVTNTLTAQTLIVQTVTSSIVYSSGSNIFGNLLSDTQQLTGSVSITGSLSVNGLTPVYTNQTSSMSVLSASYAQTASYALNVNPNATASYAVNSLSASYAETAPAYLTTASYLVDSASFSTRDTNLEATASTLVAFSASYLVASGSESTRTTNLETTASNLVAASASFSTRVSNNETTGSNLTAASASFSTRVTNNELTGSSLVAASASFEANYVKNSQTSSMTVLSASFAATASSADYFNVRNALTASGLRYPIADNGVESFIQTDGAGNLSLQYVKTLYQNIRNVEAVTILKGTPLFVSGSTGDNSNVYIADAANPARMPVTLIAGDTLAPNAVGRGIILGHIEGVDTTGYLAGTEVYVAAGGGWTSTRPTGSAQVQPLGIVTRTSINGMGIVLTVPPVVLPNTQTDYMWIGNGNQYPVQIPTSSIQNVVSSSYASNAELLDGRDSLTFANTGSNTFTGPQYVSDVSNAVNFTSTASLYTDGGLRVTKDAYVSGTIYVNNLTVYGTSSINYTTSSQVNIGSNLLTLNTDTPAIRFGGIAVFDSGSTQTSGSFLWDSERDHWLYTQPSGSGYTSGIAIFGPRNTGSLGDEQVTGFNRVMKGQGGDHITSSQIVDDGTTVSIPGNLTVTGSITGLITSASYAEVAPYYVLTSSYNADSASFSTRVTNNELTGSSLVAASASFSTRVTDNELTGSTLTTASASFSTRVTNTEATASQFITASGSLSTRTTDLESTASVLTTASASFALVSASFSSTSGSLSIRTTDLESTSSTLVAASASFEANYVKNSQTSSMTVLSASYALTASYLLNNPPPFPYTGSAQITGSLGVTGSIVVSGSGTLFTLNADILEISGSLIVSGSSVVTGSLGILGNVKATSFTGSFTGSLLGTASTASYVETAQTASYVLNAVSASYATTASFATNATDFTASNILVNGTVTAQTLNVQQVTSSIIYTSGSNIFGNLLTDTQQLTGSVTITGSLLVNDRTPLYIDQTASLSVASASYAATASYANSTATTPFNIGDSSTYYGTVNSSNVGSNNVFTLDTGSYTAAFFKYTVYNGVNARSGEVMAVWNAGTATFTDVSTLDLGSTTAVTASVSIVSSQAQLNFQTNTSGWTIKSQGTLI